MNDWNEIKNKILFSYMGTDWTSISVDHIDTKKVKDFLSEHVNIQRADKNIFKFENASTEIFFYTKSHQRFDFDPKNIPSLEQWDHFLGLFKEMSISLKTDIIFRPEDSNLYEENILVRISQGKVQYDFHVYEAYKN